MRETVSTSTRGSTFVMGATGLHENRRQSGPMSLESMSFQSLTVKQHVQELQHHKPCVHCCTTGAFC